MNKILKINLILFTLVIGLTTGCDNGAGKNENFEDSVLVTENQILKKAQMLVYDETGECKTDGTTYSYMNGCYIKGNSSNNYVWYNGFMWRIMGINYDNTVRLITNENVSAISYGNFDYGYSTTEGHIHDWLNEYFYDKLNSTKSIIQDGIYFCENYVSGAEVNENECADIYKFAAKVGLISLDEYNLSGGVSSYLNINQAFWTTSAKTTDIKWCVECGDRRHIEEMFARLTIGIRPVINVEPSSIITSGVGTSADFYVLSEDKSTNITGIISEKVTSGEYVSLEGKIYRVVSKDNNGVKLILDDFYEESDGLAYMSTYGDSNLFTLDSGIGQKLNVDVLNWLGLSESDKIIETVYYQGDAFTVGDSYSISLKQSNEVVAKVGLIRVGEMLSGQSSTILTKNYTVASDKFNTSPFWTMSIASDFDDAKYQIFDAGYAVRFGATDVAGIRPVIVVRNNLDITGGNGTWISPYQI